MTTPQDAEAYALTPDRLHGPFWAGRNWSADAGAGSIHDDATATDLGFRGGTVAGDVHTNQYVPVLLELFGDDWWERGYLTLDFKAATVDQERVQVRAEPAADGQSARVWMVREDELLVGSGFAGLGPLPALSSERARAGQADSLRILERVEVGLDLGTYQLETSPAKQFERYDQGVISDSLPAYRAVDSSGQVVACPASFVEFLWGPPMQGLRPLVDPRAVGLFGALDIAQHRGPFRLGPTYEVHAEVVALGSSPKTELLWFRSTARDQAGELAAELRMMLRFMKASVPEVSA